MPAYTQPHVCKGEAPAAARLLGWLGQGARGRAALFELRGPGLLPWAVWVVASSSLQCTSFLRFGPV